MKAAFARARSAHDAEPDCRRRSAAAACQDPTSRRIAALDAHWDQQGRRRNSETHESEVLTEHCFGAWPEPLLAPLAAAPAVVRDGCVVAPRHPWWPAAAIPLPSSRSFRRTLRAVKHYNAQHFHNHIFIQDHARCFMVALAAPVKHLRHTGAARATCVYVETLHTRFDTDRARFEPMNGMGHRSAREQIARSARATRQVCTPRAHGCKPSCAAP